MENFKFPAMIKEHFVRGVAVQVFVLSIVIIFTNSQIVIYFLILDFLTRAFITPKASLLAFLSRFIFAPLFRFPIKSIYAAPKKFAAGIGLLMSVGAAIFGFFDLTLWVGLLMGVLALFAFLEGFFNFCAGCKIYGFLSRLKIIKDDSCPDCVYPGGDSI
jgi:hypothetical protein